MRIPKSVRSRLRLRPGTRVVVDDDGASIRIRLVDRPATPGRRKQARATPRHAEDRSDLRVARRRQADPRRKLIPWSEVKANLGLLPPS